MLSKKVADLLNTQVNKEFYSAYLYLDFANFYKNKALDGFAPSVLDSREVAYRCDCSRERTREMLLSLGRKELEKLRDEDPHCEVVCHFCHAKYEFDLDKLLKELPAQA